MDPLSAWSSNPGEDSDLPQLFDGVLSNDSCLNTSLEWVELDFGDYFHVSAVFLLGHPDGGESRFWTGWSFVNGSFRSPLGEEWSPDKTIWWAGVDQDIPHLKIGRDGLGGDSTETFPLCRVSVPPYKVARSETVLSYEAAAAFCADKHHGSLVRPAVKSEADALFREASGQSYWTDWDLVDADTMSFESGRWQLSDRGQLAASSDTDKTAVRYSGDAGRLHMVDRNIRQEHALCIIEEPYFKDLALEVCHSGTQSCVPCESLDEQHVTSRGWIHLDCEWALGDHVKLAGNSPFKTHVNQILVHGQLPPIKGAAKLSRDSQMLQIYQPVEDTFATRKSEIRLALDSSTRNPGSEAAPGSLAVSTATIRSPPASFLQYRILIQGSESHGLYPIDVECNAGARIAANISGTIPTNLSGASLEADLGWVANTGSREQLEGMPDSGVINVAIIWRISESASGETDGNIPYSVILNEDLSSSGEITLKADCSDCKDDTKGVKHWIIPGNLSVEETVFRPMFVTVTFGIEQCYIEDVNITMTIPNSEGHCVVRGNASFTPVGSNVRYSLVQAVFGAPTFDYRSLTDNARNVDVVTITIAKLEHLNLGGAEEFGATEDNQFTVRVPVVFLDYPHSPDNVTKQFTWAVSARDIPEVGYTGTLNLLPNPDRKAIACQEMWFESTDDAIVDSSNVTIFLSLSHCDNSSAAMIDPSMTLLVPGFVKVIQGSMTYTADDLSDLLCDTTQTRSSEGGNLSLSEDSQLFRCSGFLGMLDTLVIRVNASFEKEKLPETYNNYVNSVVYSCAEYASNHRSDSTYPADMLFRPYCVQDVLTVKTGGKTCDVTIDVDEFEECQVVASSSYHVINSPKTAYLRNTGRGWRSNTWGGPQFLKVGLTALTELHELEVRADDMFNCFRLSYSHDGTSWSEMKDRRRETRQFCKRHTPMTHRDGVDVYRFELRGEQPARYVMFHFDSYHGLDSASLRMQLVGCPVGPPVPLQHVCGIRKLNDITLGSYIWNCAEQEMFICRIDNAKTDYVCYMGQWKEGPGRWRRIQGVLNIIGYSPSSGLLYGVAMSGLGYVSSSDLGRTWSSISTKAWWKARADSALLAHQVIPSVLPPGEPPGDLLIRQAVKGHMGSQGYDPKCIVAPHFNGMYQLFPEKQPNYRLLVGF